MEIGALENKIKVLEDQVRALQTLLDIEEIKKLQRAYGYYLEHWMAQEIIDLFADGDGVCLDFPWNEGTYLGKAGVRRYYEGRFKPDRELFHQIMPISPIIDINSNGIRAKGRWYGYGAIASPRGQGMGQSIINGIYENEYVKEDGKWKFLRISWALNYLVKPGQGWVSADRLATADPNFKMTWPEPDIPPTGFNPKYPSGFIFPFHYNHPVTGHETSERQINKTIEGLDNA